MKRFFSTVAAIALLAGGLFLGNPAFAQGKKKTEDKAAAVADKAGDKAGKKGAAVPDSERCIGQTQDGDRCKRKAADGSKYCWQHDPNRKAKGKKK